MRILPVLLALLAAASPGQAQETPDPDETVVRTGDDDETVVRTGDDDETVVRTGDDDEAVVRTGDDDEAVVEPPAPPAEKPPPRLRFGGRVQDRLSFDTWHEGKGEHVFENRLKADLFTDVRFLDGARIYLEGRLTHYVVGENAGAATWTLANSRGVKTRAEVELREAFVFYPNRWINVRVGNQVVRWGAGQFQKPMDVLNPTDLREGLMSDLETPQIPVPMVHLDRSFGPVNLAAVWIPFFVPNRVNMFGHDFSPAGAMAAHPDLPGAAGIAGIMGTMAELLHPSLEDRVQPLLAASDPPPDDLGGSQLGFRAQGRFGPVDLGLTYFWGWDKFPTVHLNTELMATAGALLADAQTVMGFYGAHPEVLAAMTGVDLEDPASMLAVADAMAGIGEDPEEAETFYAAMDAMQRLMAGAETLPTDLRVNDLFRTSFRRQHVLGLDLAAVLFDEVGLTLGGAWSPERTVYLQSTDGFPAA
ncbi:MAG: hypothetical protein FJ098_05805, partial [Deltaproteobacteria bacterium]|nr:hypothetical protein [Deltaproteobacteria bacterium]